MKADCRTTTISFGCRFAFLLNSPRRLHDYLIGSVEFWFRLGDVFGDACKRLEHRRLIVGWQADQLAAMVGPKLPGVGVELVRPRSEGGGLGSGILVEDLLQV